MASVDTGRGGARDTLRLFDTAGLQSSSQQLPRHYLQLADGFVIVYDPHDTASLQTLDMLRADIERNKEKKEVAIVVVANLRAKQYHHRRAESPDFVGAVADGGAAAVETNALASPSRTAAPDADASANYARIVEAMLQQASIWCARERIRHYTVNALERASLYDPFIGLAVRLHPPPTKSGFDHLRQLTHKTSRVENN